MMHYFAGQVTLISALLLRINAQAFYDHQHSTSHLGTPNIKIIKVEHPSVHGVGGQRELLILQGQHPYQGLHIVPHVVTLAKIGVTAAQNYGSAHPHYTKYTSVCPQEHHVAPSPKYDYGKPQQSHVVAVEPHKSHIPGAHVSVYDVNLPTQGPHLNNPPGLHESVPTIPKPFKDELRPDIDVRSSNPSPAMRTSGKEDPKIVFPPPSQDTDDSVEVFAPVREHRDVRMRFPVEEPVVRTLYRYVMQPVVKYPQQY